MFLILFAFVELEAAIRTWLPQGSIFTTPWLDPAAAHQTISLLSYEVEGESQQLMYVPITVSLRQLFLRSITSPEKVWEAGMEFNIHSQFSVVDVGEAYMGGLQNADYRISGILHVQHRPELVSRVSIFHQSSHLGDDYIIRNAITTPTMRTLNYEQLDYTAMLRSEGRGIYVTLGYNVSPNTVRERAMVQLGMDLTRPWAATPGVAWVAGMNLKLYEHTEFRPNLRLALGVEFARGTDTPAKLFLNYYQGHLPFSTLEYQKVRLMGLSLSFDFPR